MMQKKTHYFAPTACCPLRSAADRWRHSHPCQALHIAVLQAAAVHLAAAAQPVSSCIGTCPHFNSLAGTFGTA